MENQTIILIGTALSIGFFHTVLGPDHYLPFIMISKARRWSIGKTTVITFLCGIGHVLSSVVLGFIGIALGVAVFKLEAIESFRAEIAAWLLLAFGFTYFIWGLRRAMLNKPHSHLHIHDHEQVHVHTHAHKAKHIHLHEVKTGISITPWVLFTIFIFGPCEPLIPVLMYPAARGSITEVIMVVSVFGITTVSTMLAIVLAFSCGLSRMPFLKLERYAQAMAGLIIFLCAIAVKFLGL